MRWKTEMRAAGLVLAGVLVGTLLGPPLAHAAGSLVTIASGSKASQLHIAKGKAKVDTGAALVPSPVSGGKAIVDEGLQFTIPFGEAVIASGSVTTANVCTSFWILDSIAVDAPSGGPATVSITANGTPVWSGTVAAGGHLNDTFDGAVSSVQQPLNVTETGSGATWYLYGFCASGNALRSPQSVPGRGGR